VVLTNPTHYAVALGFDFSLMDAPRVLAKGRNLLAEEIKAEARWAGVPVVENPPLARSLYRSVEVGQAIPVDLYAAVAAVLAYLYRQRVETEIRERRAREAAARARSAMENRVMRFAGPAADVKGRRNDQRQGGKP
jgi:flagellar biosynthetic protein FlhB